MSLRDDIQLAQPLLKEPLSAATKPTEKEARAAARRVLEAVSRSIREEQGELFDAGVTVFLDRLAKALDPASVPGTEKQFYTRKADFEDASQGAGRTRAALHRRLQIAIEVHLLKNTGKKGKGAVSLVAKKYDMDSSQVSKICAAPGIKQEIAAWLRLAVPLTDAADVRFITMAEAAEELEKLK